MKKYTFLIITILSMLMLGCKDRNSPSEPEKTAKQYGKIQIINNHTDPYTVTVKGNTSSSFMLYGNKYQTISVEVGYYNVHVKQFSGYILYPTEKDYELRVYANKQEVISF